MVPLLETRLAEILLDFMDNSENMKNDIAEFRRRNATVFNRSTDYKYLMDIMGRHIAAMNEKTNNIALCQASGKAGKVVAVVSTPGGGTGGGGGQE